MDLPPVTPLSVYPDRPPDPPHSGLGIAACILAGLVVLAYTLLFAIGGYVETSHPGGLDANEHVTTLLGLAAIFLGLVTLVALILAIISLCLPNRRKLFPILGVCFNVLLLLGFAALLVAGAVAK